MPLAGPILLCAAMDAELVPVARSLELSQTGDRYEGQFRDTPVIASTLGVGAEHATQRLTALLDDLSPRVVVLIGFAGGLDPFWQAGYSLFPHWLASTTHRDIIALDAAVPARLSPDESSAPVDPRRTLLTSSVPVLTVEDKAKAAVDYGAAAVDMESYHLAALAAERDQPMCIIRAISDAAGDNLPVWTMKLVDPAGRSRVGAAIAGLLIHPWRLGEMLRLRRAAEACTQSLAVCVEGKLSEWVDE